MSKTLIQKLCIGGFALLSSLNLYGQVTTVTETFDDNKPSNFRAGQGFFVKAENQVLKVKVGKQAWEEFSYDLPMDLTAAPKVSMRIKTDFPINFIFALLDSDGNDNRFYEDNFTIFPSKDFIEIGYDFTGKLKLGTKNAVDPSKIKSIRFMVDPGVEKSCNIEIDDFKVGSAATAYPRLVAPGTQKVYINSPQQKVLLRGLVPGSIVTATSSNTALIPNPIIGALSAIPAGGVGILGTSTAVMAFTPTPNQSGTSKITVKVSKPGLTDLLVSFDVIVSPNLAPTIDAVSGVNNGAGLSQKILLKGISDGNTEREQKLTITATSSDQSVLKDGNISIDYVNPFTHGSMTFKTEALSSGSKNINITLTIKDDGGTDASGVDTKTIVIPVTVYASYYKSPTVNKISNNNFAYVGTNYKINISGITDGNGGNKVASVVATSSNAAAVDNPTVTYTPGSNTAELSFTAKSKETATISVVITNTGAPANSNGNSSTTATFTVRGVDPAFTGYIEDFSSYGVDGKTPTPLVLGGDYYTSGTGGDDRVTWMTNPDAYDQKWFIEGQGVEQTITIDGANKKATVVYNKPATVPNTFAGIWYSPRKLFNLSNAKYLSMRVSASVPTTVTFDIFDVNNKRYGHLQANQKKVNSTGGVFTFVFDQAPDQEGFDFSKIASVLINVSNLMDYKGTITISELKIGDQAVGAPLPKPASIEIDPVANRTVLLGQSSLTVPLSNVAVMKDDINQGKAINLSITSSNTQLIPTPSVPNVENNNALLKFTPTPNQIGKSTITVTASSAGIPDKVITFDVSVVEKNRSGATTIAIDQANTFQTISGIGTVSENMEESVGDLGVSMLRFDMGGEYEPGLEGIENDNDDPFVLDITKFSFSPRYDFKKAYELGCKRVIGCVWTPPVWMKGVLSHRPQFPVQPNVLLPDFYDEFAEYIVGSCIAFKNTFGFEMYSINLQNEAEFGSSANLTATCQYTKETAAEIVRRVYPRLIAAGLTTKIHGFDQLPAQGNVLNWFKYLNDNSIIESISGKTTKDMIDAFSFHSYEFNAQDVGTLRSDELQSFYAECQRVNPKKELWMTETSGEPGGEAGGLWQIATQFTVYSNNLNCWVNLGVGSHDGMKYYAYKNFTKFIKPGALRLGTTNSNGIAALAFRNDAEKTYTIVLSNLGTTDQQVKLGGTAGLPSKMYAYMTSPNINCELVDTVYSGDNYMVYLPMKSVLTLSSKYENVTDMEESIAANMEMIVYPNPSKGELNIILPSSTFKEISVLDIMGREVMKQSIKANGNGQERLDLSRLPKGIYIISAKGETSLKKKILVD